MKKIFFIILFPLFAIPVSAKEKAPDPPIPLEILFGHKGANFSFSLNKSIGSIFRFNNITTAIADYKAISKTELVTVNSFICQFHKNIGVSAGFQWHFKKGFVPIAAMHFSYAKPYLLVLCTPYLDFMPWFGMEAIAIVEYKPRIIKELRLFTRAQLFYGHNLKKNLHERSMAYFRLGLMIRKYTFGAAANLDYYGPKITETQNFGAFFRVDL